MEVIQLDRVIKKRRWHSRRRTRGVMVVVHKKTLPLTATFFKNMEGKDFLQLLKHSDCLIGNSSVGIRECAFLGVPVVNIGSRQNKRDRGHNVIDVDYNKNEITDAVHTILKNGKSETSNVYGGGNSGSCIADLLTTVPLQFHKTIMY